MQLHLLTQQLDELPCGFAIYYSNKLSRSQQSYGKGGQDIAGLAPLSSETPFRIASNTKTFTAAAILRLWEMGKLKLDTPIAELINPAYDALLRPRHNTTEIQVHHLLAHSSGMYDHADERFIAKCLANPQYIWSREELLQCYMDKNVPFVAPSQQFIYSDTGYILLGDIIERLTGRSLGDAVRSLLKFDQIGLETAWWEDLESIPHNSLGRAKQYLGDIDVTELNPSMDLYGGGGLIMSSRQLALFMEALFEGKIFDKPETLTQMLVVGEHQDASDYRFGLFANSIEETHFYSHLGFWGSAVYYSPEKQICVAGFVDNNNYRAQLVDVMKQLTAYHQ